MGKNQILCSGYGNVKAYIDENAIISDSKNELLGIILDLKLSFEDHVKNFCKKQVKNLTH